jgi:hypothetical protein
MKNCIYLSLFKQKLEIVAEFPEKSFWLNLAKNIGAY